MIKNIGRIAVTCKAIDLAAQSIDAIADIHIEEIQLQIVKENTKTECKKEDTKLALKQEEPRK